MKIKLINLLKLTTATQWYHVPSALEISHHKPIRFNHRPTHNDKFIEMRSITRFDGEIKCTRLLRNNSSKRRLLTTVSFASQLGKYKSITRSLSMALG